jgi:hypothetical protein
MRAKRLAAVVMFVLLCASEQARAFVPYRTTTGQVYHWPRACIVVRGVRRAGHL